MNQFDCLIKMVKIIQAKKQARSILSEEEKQLFVKEGYRLPQRLPLTKVKDFEHLEFKALMSI